MDGFGRCPREADSPGIGPTSTTDGLLIEGNLIRTRDGTQYTAILETVVVRQ